MINIYSAIEPEAVLSEQILALERSAEEMLHFAVHYSFSQYYLADCPDILLTAVFGLYKENDVVRVHGGVVPHSDKVSQSLEAIGSQGDIEQVIQALDLAWFNLNAPVVLKPVHIPKPWGQEIWYTGIEERGQALAVAPNGKEVKLPWLLSVAPALMVNNHEKDLILLKILDPLPEEVYGDLYFEMHEVKQEVYVVTHVDHKAWPSGEGGIRFGFCPEKVKQYEDPADFCKAYFAAVKAYEKVRRDIDTTFDKHRIDEGVALNEPVQAATLKKWQKSLSSELILLEQSHRKEMESFTSVKSIRQGDVVSVPCFTPHSLLHGVRTVEFQTPVYERKILSFAQKVLTQSHWDTEDALEKVKVIPDQLPPLKQLFSMRDITFEEIVNFDDFCVFRLFLPALTTIALPALLPYMSVIKEPLTHDCETVHSDQSEIPEKLPYAVLMSIKGEVFIDAQPLSEEQALLLPSELSSSLINNVSNLTAIVLISIPKKAASG